MCLLQTVPDLVDQRTMKFPEGRTDDTFKARKSLCAVKMHCVMQTNDQKAVQRVAIQRTERSLAGRATTLTAGVLLQRGGRSAEWGGVMEGLSQVEG